MLAYSTDEGLWLWDVLTVDVAPRLLRAATDSVPLARHFSPQGRYLAIEENGRRFHLDLVTEHELPDGFISPNDRTLLIFDTYLSEPQPLEVAFLAPGIRRFEYYPEVQFQHVQWIDEIYFRAAITGPRYFTLEPMEGTNEAQLVVVEEPFVDVIDYHVGGMGWMPFSDIPYLLQPVQYRDFEFEPGPGLIKISADGYQILVDGSHFAFDSVLPAPIKHVEWLPSVFFYEEQWIR